MLVLSRRPGEEIIISGGIRVRVVSVQGGKVRLGVAAPPAVRVDRREIRDLREQAADAVQPDADANVASDSQ